MSSNELLLKIKKRRKSISNRELLIAASEGQLLEVQMLIDAGADSNFIDSDGNTALHYAVASNKFEVVKCLLRLPDVDPTYENNANVTPLDLARERNVKPIVDLVEEQIWRNALHTVEEEFPRNTADNTSWRNKTNTNFMEATFAGNFMVPLQVDDVKNILMFRYFKDKGNIIFGVTSCKQDLKKMLEEVKNNPKKCIILASLHHSRWTAIAIDYKSDEKCFNAMIENLDFRYDNLTFQNILSNALKANVHFYDFPYETYESIWQVSGVYALKFGDIFLGNSNIKQMRQYDWKCFDVNAEKSFLANLLNEKRRTEQKVEACSKILKNLVEHDETIVKLTHQNINAFVLFLETFALEDTYIPGDSKLEKDIRKIKKEYFTHFYFQPKNEKIDGRPDYRLIVDARASLLHNSRILTVDECSKFIGKRKRVKDFFKDLSSFTEGMCTKVLFLDKQEENIKCCSFLADKTEYQNIGVEDGLEQLGKFMKNLYPTGNMITDVKLEEITFELIVNIIPLLENKREKFGPLGNVRNELIHNFQKYDSPMERLREMKKLTFPLKSKLFKFFYAIKVHEVLKKYCLYETIESLDSKIVGALKDFGDEAEEIAHVASLDDANSFEYLFEASIFPRKDESLDKLVEQYFEFMVIVDHETDLNAALNNDDGHQMEGSEVVSDITDLQRREIFEDMVKIKCLMKTNDDFTKNKLMDLKTKLASVGISKSCVGSKIDKTFYNNQNHLKDQTKLQMKQIRDNLLLIKHLLTDYLIPIQTLISSYKSNNFAPLLESLREFSKRDNTCLVGKLNSLLSGYFKVQFDDVEIQISYATITINILKLFYSAFNKYQIKFNNAGEAFKDEDFLNFLTSRFCQRDERDELYAYAMLKKLPKIMYTTPFLVCLLEKFPNILIDPVETRNIFEIFCSDNFVRPFLGNFIKVVSTGIHPFNFEDIVSILLGKEKNDINVIDVIMQDSRCLEEFLNEILKRLKKKPSPRVIQLTQVALEVIIKNVRQFMYNKSYIAADQLIEQEKVLALFSAFVEHDNFTVNEFYLYSAKIKNFRGVQEKQKKNFETADLLYQNALIYLSKVNSPDTRQNFLVLSRTSYTMLLLRNFDGAFNGFKRLYKNLIEFALSETNLPDDIFFDSSYYDIVENSNHYMNLLESSEDNRKYLELFEIKFSMAYGLIKQRKYQEAVQIYQDIYIYQKGHERFKNRINRTLNNIARVSEYLGDDYSKDNKNTQAFKCYIDNLVALSKAMKIMKEIHGGIHPVNKDFGVHIKRVVGSINKCVGK